MSHLPLLPVGTKGMMEDTVLKAEAGFFWEILNLISSTAQNKRSSRKDTHKPYSNGQVWARSLFWPRNKGELYYELLEENMPQRQP